MSKIIDMTGQRFGSLVVIGRPTTGPLWNRKRHSTLWLCKCDCGNLFTSSRPKLLNKENTSCGCKRWNSEFIDETGKRYGLLTVIKYAGSGKKRTEAAMWLCKCDCGKEVKVLGTTLRGGGRISCGCKHTDRGGFSGEYHIIGNIKSGAFVRGIVVELSDREIMSFLHKPCVYCGRVDVNKTGKGKFRYNAIDRINSSKGYIQGNVVPCCGPCNKAKSTLELSAFKQLIRSIYNNWASDPL